MKTSAFLRFSGSLLLMTAASFVSCSDDDDAVDTGSQPEQLTGVANGHEWVDLGLSVMWATCNVGATSPSDFGDYFAWGETKPKESYSSANSMTYGQELGDIAGHPDYDAARANWNDGWRLPTAAEFQELLDNCTFEWTSQAGHNGYLATSEKNGQSIFLPVAGHCDAGTSPEGWVGLYWSSTPLNSHEANYLFLVASGHHVSQQYLYHGLTIRPVIGYEQE